MMRMARYPRSLPRWPVLLALVMAVLGAHLLLLAGGVHIAWPNDRQKDLPEVQQVALDATTDEAGEALTPQPLTVAAMQVSTVRWIAPSKPPLAADTQSPPAAPTAVPAQPGRTPGITNEIQVVMPTPEVDEPEPPATADSGPPPAGPPPEAAPPAAAAPAPAQQPQAEASAPPQQPTMADAQQPTPPAPLDDTALAAAGTTPARTPAGAARTPPPAQLPASVRLGYDIRGKAKGLGYSADAQLQWLVEGPRYTAELEISAFLVGSRVQTSQGSVGPHGLLPLRFGDRRRGTEKAAHFDHARQLIRFSNNAPDVPLQPGAQDRLSVFLQLGALLQARPQAYPEGASIAVQVASTGGAEVWQFQVGALQSLSLPAGPVVARRLLREPRREYDSTVEVWLAPSLQHLPVRIRVTEHDGSLADQLLRQLPPQPPSPPEATR